MRITHPLCISIAVLTTGCITIQSPGDWEAHTQDEPRTLRTHTYYHNEKGEWGTTDGEITIERDFAKFEDLSQTRYPATVAMGEGLELSCSVGQPDSGEPLYRCTSADGSMTLSLGGSECGMLECKSWRDVRESPCQRGELRVMTEQGQRTYALEMGTFSSNNNPVPHFSLSGPDGDIYALADGNTAPQLLKLWLNDSVDMSARERRVIKVAMVAYHESFHDIYRTSYINTHPALATMFVIL